MKKLLILAISLISLCEVQASSTVTQNYFTNQLPISKTRQLSNKVFSNTDSLSLETNESVYGLYVSGKIEFKSPKGFVRLILVDKSGNEHLIYEEDCRFIEGNSTEFSNSCIETAVLNGVRPASVKIISYHAQLTLDDISWTNAATKNRQSRSIATADIKKLQEDVQIEKWNDYIKKKGYPWVAGHTGLSSLSYSEKKTLFGDNSDSYRPNGYEYYSGGIFYLESSDTISGNVQNNIQAPNALSATQEPFVHTFDWRHRHGRNWITPVKSQIVPQQPDTVGNGGCWAFVTVAAVEAMTNLYFNRQINYDLSEQCIISCSNAGYANSKKSTEFPRIGGSSLRTKDYITQTGIVPESCFPFQNANVPCGNKCSNPTEIIKVKDINTLMKVMDGGYGIINDSIVDLYIPIQDEAGLKRHLIKSGPKIVTLGFSNVSDSWGHTLLLVGYGTVSQGSEFYYLPNQAPDFTPIAIPPGSPFIGQTYWVLKNSYGLSHGNNGFDYVILEDFYAMSNYKFEEVQYPIQSLRYDDSDIVCEDLDGDGYYNWGIGPKPAHCPPCPAEPDGNDYNPNLGPMDEYGNCRQLIPITTLPSIQGPDYFGCGATYTVMNLPEDYSVTWSVDDNEMDKLIIYQEPIDAMVNVQQGTIPNLFTGFSLYTGSITLKATLHNPRAEAPLQTIILTKEIYIYGNIVPDFNFPEEISAGLVYIFHADNYYGLPNDALSVYFSSTSASVDLTDNNHIIVRPTMVGHLSITIGCELSCVGLYRTYQINIIPPNIFVVYNNPASNVLDVSISLEDTDEPKISQTNTLRSAPTSHLPYQGEYRFEIWHESNSLVKTYTYDNAPQITLDISDLEPGSYFVRVFVGEEMRHISQLIVR